MKNVCLLIPSYKPSSSLTNLIEKIRTNFKGYILVVDDGNTSSDSQKIFQDLKDRYQVEVVHHAHNLGKGRALKTGINHVLVSAPEVEWVITADSDGQHSDSDIVNICNSSLQLKNQDLILGYRQFSGDIPFRSKFGNNLSRYIFKFFIGLNINDTQTGLRGYNKRILASLLNIGGERFEFETNLLLEAKKLEWSIHQIPIQTIYIEQNKSSHFNPITDSMKIYFLIFRFLASAIASSAIDFVVFATLIGSGYKIYQSTLMARLVSGWFNFYFNRNLVFKQKSQLVSAMIRYWALVYVMGTLSSFVINGLVHYWNQPLILKLLTESFLFFISYAVQKEFIFTKKDKT